MNGVFYCRAQGLLQINRLCQLKMAAPGRSVTPPLPLTGEDEECLCLIMRQAATSLPHVHTFLKLTDINYEGNKKTYSRVS